MSKYIKKSFSPHIYQDWIHLFRQCSPEQRSELLLSITDFPNHEPEIEISIWDFIKSQLDTQYQSMENKSQQMSTNRNNKKQKSTEVNQSRPMSTEVDQSSQIEIETGIETRIETEIKEKEISDDISKKKFTADSEIDVNGQDFGEFPAECMPLLREYWTDAKIESIRKDLAAMYPHKTTVRRLLDKYPENKSEERRAKMNVQVYGENKKVRLTDEEYAKLQELYGRRLENAIQILDGYLAENTKNEKKYTSHYAVMRRNNWVYNKTFDGDFVPLKPQVADMSKFVKAKPLGEEND